MTKLEAAFKKFDEANPQVWRLFIDFTFASINAGHRHMGVAMIVERIRWETMITTRNSKFKINNNHRAYYVRKFEEIFAQHRDYFRKRKVKKEPPQPPMPGYLL
jgi:hypothetical protein